MYLQVHHRPVPAVLTQASALTVQEITVAISPRLHKVGAKVLKAAGVKISIKFI